MSTVSAVPDDQTFLKPKPKDGNVCANAGTDREAYCTYALGPVLYPDDYPVDYHFCAYCADD